ncbi:hypothetical protein NMG60_11002276 [Bertholletia excelsa]
MAMAMRAAAKVAAEKPLGLRGLFSTLSSSLQFTPPTATNQPQRPPPPEPSSNLFVSGLNKRTTTEGLREAFSKFGQVVDAKVVTDRHSGYSKGFGFVRYATLEEAAEGIKGMDGQFLDGWVIFAEYARPKVSPLPGNSAQPPRSPPSYGTCYGRQ